VVTNFLVEPTARGGFFDNIMTPETSMEGNIVAANGEFVAVSLKYSQDLSLLDAMENESKLRRGSCIA
jgi:hypothetical protein